MRARLGFGLATSIGSLPHRDADAAAAAVLRRHPRLPAVPSLPRRSLLEGMLAQVVAGVDGISVDRRGALVVDGPIDDDSAAPVDLDVEPFSEAFAGMRAFLDALARAAERPAMVKWQLTGPVTLSLALIQAGVPPRQAGPVAGRLVRRRAGELRRLMAAALPDCDQVAFLDEPGLTGLGHPGFPLSAEDAIDLVSSALSVLEPAATTGIHCCGTTDWGTVRHAGADILSLAVGTVAPHAAHALSSHLDAGGWIAWGAVPTDGPLGTTEERLWRGLAQLWCDLVQGGCDPVALRAQALVTPQCGLAFHGESQAVRVLELTSRLADRVHDQAAATRFSLGA